MTGKFCLKWNDFQSNIASAFSECQTKTNFQDVTLVSDDYKQISAHRVILSACSGYFQNVLSQNAHSHPLLCLDGITFSELSNVLDYIYTGELQLHHEDLERFLQIAQRLQLQGLLSSEALEQNEEIEADIEDSESKTLSVQTKEKKIISFNSSDFPSIEQLDLYIEQQIIRNDAGYMCNICNIKTNGKRDMKEHIEIHIDGLSFDCNICGRIMRTRKNLRIHKIRVCNKNTK